MPEDLQNPNQDSLNNQELGLLDGQFYVQRSDGSIETGWSIADRIQVPNFPAEAVKITKSEKGEILSKVVAIRDLLRLQEDQKKLELDQVAADAGKVSLNQSVELAEGIELESPRELYLREIFKPPLPDQPKPEAKRLNYDFLFDPDYEPPELVERAAVRSPELVSQHTAEYSKRTLSSALVMDQHLARELGLADMGVLPDSELDMLVQKIRQDPELRIKLGKYYLSKIKSNRENLPDRVKRNSQKNPNFVSGRYEAIRSQDYVALLCLSKLDGTFDPYREDEIVEDPVTKQAQLGQHRWAAESVLFS